MVILGDRIPFSLRFPAHLTRSPGALFGATKRYLRTQCSGTLAASAPPGPPTGGGPTTKLGNIWVLNVAAKVSFHSIRRQSKR